jgi:hypothetical protein
VGGEHVRRRERSKAASQVTGRVSRNGSVSCHGCSSRCCAAPIPSELPVEQPTSFEFVLDLQAHQGDRLRNPRLGLVLRTNKVIE